MAKTHIRFNDDIDHYEPSDSEDDYTENEKKLLEKVRTKKHSESDSEEEVYGLDSDIAESDIEGQDDDDLPDARAWGKTKRDFYSTDYVDQDYGGYDGKDAEAADFEEEEAKNIQKRLAEQLNDEDFSLDIFDKKPVEERIENEELIKSDLSTLSKRELIQILEKESPEFFVLVDDCKAKIAELKQFLCPVIELKKENKIPECEALNFVTTFYQLILNYSTNITMYLLLKASKVNMKTHPILKRLYQYRQLISQLEPIYNEIIRPQLEIIINSENNISNEKPEIPVKKIKKLKLLENIDKNPKRKLDKTSPLDVQTPSKKTKVESILKQKKSIEIKQVTFEDNMQEENNDTDNELSEKEEENGEGEEDTLENSKRAITYQIAKNKGLTPHRKKEQRNPRVKHRNKYRKAVIRRKGAVREVRKELSRYGGEMSGIKATVSKSIKIK